MMVGGLFAGNVAVRHILETSVTTKAEPLMKYLMEVYQIMSLYLQHGLPLYVLVLARSRKMPEER